MRACCVLCTVSVKSVFSNDIAPLLCWFVQYRMADVCWTHTMPPLRIVFVRLMNDVPADYNACVASNGVNQPNSEDILKRLQYDAKSSGVSIDFIYLAITASKKSTFVA